MRTSRRGDAIKLLEPLDQSNQLGTTEQFILAQTYLAERLVDKYRGQMLKILASGVKNPRHLVHFVDFLIDRQELDQADHWLAELKKVAPRSLGLARAGGPPAQGLRNRDAELLGLLQARGRQVPDEIGVVAGLLDRFGFAGEAEAAYKAFIARKPGEPERVLALASFLARQDRTKEAVAILDQAWKTCRPEAVASDIAAALSRTLRRRGPQATGGGLGRRGHQEEPRRGRLAPSQAGRHLWQARALRRGRGPLSPDPGQRPR